jgi:hypothetical protein
MTSEQWHGTLTSAPCSSLDCGSPLPLSPPQPAVEVFLDFQCGLFLQISIPDWGVIRDQQQKSLDLILDCGSPLPLSPPQPAVEVFLDFQCGLFLQISIPDWGVIRDQQQAADIRAAAGCRSPGGKFGADQCFSGVSRIDIIFPLSIFGCCSTAAMS